MSPKYAAKPKWYFPYVLDNGAWGGFEDKPWKTMLLKAQTWHKPMFVCSPDKVGDAEVTLRNYFKYSPWIRSMKYKPAIVAQDGMEQSDIPLGVDAIFVGGTTHWKLHNAHKFKGVSDWLHIGRVNNLNRLTWAEAIGADSVDGSGWLAIRGANENNKYTRILLEYLGMEKKQCSMF